MLTLAEVYADLTVAKTTEQSNFKEENSTTAHLHFQSKVAYSSFVNCGHHRYRDRGCVGVNDPRRRRRGCCAAAFHTAATVRMACYRALCAALATFYLVRPSSLKT
jgi:hypothetical protein